jgi:dipeptidyl aminopeptidase/acylaminoacyl peptidase
MKKKIFFTVLFFLLVLTLGFWKFSERVKWQREKRVINLIPLQEETQEEKKPLPADSLPAMSEKEYFGTDLKLGKILSDNEFYTRHFITYKSEGLKISGIMNIPKGKGPFPVLILNHGFIEPKFYTNGQGLKREQDFLAKNGYAILHSDYRNHAQSDFDPENDVRPRAGYVEDVLNAISAVRNSSFPFLDKENIGMLGHSMGGGIALNVMVIKPEAVKAAILLAPISSSYKANFDRWVAPEMKEIAEKFYSLYGRYEENPEIWESFSAKNYLDKIKTPIQLHQGTLDKDVPVEWSRELTELLKKEERDITYYEYPGEPHTFAAAQGLVMQRTLEFFNKSLKK